MGETTRIKGNEPLPKKKTAADTTQTTLPFPSENDEHLNISTLETWLWDAACVIRGATDAPKFKDFILPLIFYKRLSDVFDDEFAGHIEEFGDEAIAREITEADHADALKRDRDDPIVRFYIPQKYNWKALRNPPPMVIWDSLLPMQCVKSPVVTHGYRVCLM